MYRVLHCFVYFGVTRGVLLMLIAHLLFSSQIEGSALNVFQEALLVQTVKQLWMYRCCLQEVRHVDRTILFNHPLHYFYLPSLSGNCGSSVIPWTTILSRPLQYLQVAACCCRLGKGRVPRTTFLSCPLQDLKMVVLGCKGASFFIPWTSLSFLPISTQQDGCF